MVVNKKKTVKKTDKKVDPRMRQFTKAQLLHNYDQLKKAFDDADTNFHYYKNKAARLKTQLFEADEEIVKLKDIAILTAALAVLSLGGFCIVLFM